MMKKLLIYMTGLLLVSMLVVADVAAGEMYYTVKDGVLLLTDTPDGERTTRLRFDKNKGTRKSGKHGKPDLPVTQWDSLIRRAAGASGIDPDLLKTVVWAESNFNATAVSPKGAIGLMQLMPATAAAYGVSDPRMLRDPERNLLVGSRHLRGLLDRYNGDITLALAAYNAGAGAVRKYNGVPAYRETQNYVRKINQRLGAEPRRARSAGNVAVSRPIRQQRSQNGTLSYSN